MKHEKFRYEMLLKIAMFIVGVVAIFKIIVWNNNVSHIPPVSKGNCVVFYEEMDRFMGITEIDSTEQFIFFEYSSPGVVAVYDWAGNYHCSFAFYTDTNGTVDMRCDSNILYVHDNANYEFVFSGTENIGVFDSESRPHRIGWFTQPNTMTLVVKGRGLYDSNGEFIMNLPGHIQ